MYNTSESAFPSGLFVKSLCMSVCTFFTSPTISLGGRPQQTENSKDSSAHVPRSGNSKHFIVREKSSLSFPPKKFQFAFRRKTQARKSRCPLRTSFPTRIYAQSEHVLSLRTPGINTIKNKNFQLDLRYFFHIFFYQIFFYHIFFYHIFF